MNEQVFFSRSVFSLYNGSTRIRIRCFFTSSVGVLGVVMLIQSLKTGRSLMFAMFVFGRVENLPELETKASKWRYPGGRVLLHHPKVNTYTLTLEDVPGSPPPNLRHDVEELQHLIRSHRKVSHCCVFGCLWQLVCLWLMF